ncbi:MAG: sensor histidine kinase, partial [Saprospiraceae bacterium]
NLSFRPQPDGTFIFEIRDDGKGFDPKNVRQFSNGLSSMRGRAEELGGTLAVETAPGRGTTVRLSGKIWGKAVPHPHNHIFVRYPAPRG